MTQASYELIVIGAGPGGYVGAIRAAQLGMKVALIEKFEHLGGTCLNVGCIPTKALLESSKIWTKLNHVEELGFEIGGKPKFKWDKIMGRKNGIVDSQRKGLLFLMKKNKIDVFKGHGQFVDQKTIACTDADGKKMTLKTQFTLIATGSRVRELPFAKSNGKTILTSDTVLFIDHIPKTMCVVGGGVVGMEFACMFAGFGTEVTVVEMAPQVLPYEDAEAVGEAVKAFKKLGIKIETSSKLTKVEDKGDHCLVGVEGVAERKFDRVLMSIGREPVTDKLGLENIGLTTDRGFIRVDSHYQTSIPNIFAIGDVINTPALAHTASAEAIHAAEVMAGKGPHPIDYEANPSAVYTFPEIASIGKTEEALKKANIEYKVAKFPFAPMAKARIEDATQGFVKILYDPKYRELLGVHIIGAKATEMIGEFVLGKVLETTVDEIAHAIHPHPTISETIMETAHVAMGGAIHL
jgi:dihydrolipoamide dehydrogenase